MIFESLISSFTKRKAKGTSFGLETPSTEVNGGDPQEVLKRLTPESKVRGTSYSEKQNEVRDMIEATRKGRWPGFWYELLQGAYEYNNWREGLPTILVYYQHSSEPVSLSQFATDRRRLLRFKVQRVEIRNFIRGEAGLRPNNVAVTEHDEKNGGAGLSRHGRGMKISSTAASGPLAKGITYDSWYPGIGAWHGAGEVGSDEGDPNSNYFQLRYNNNPHLRTNETVFTVWEPNNDALRALADLPQWFLPTNPAYAHYKLQTSAAEQKPNLATVYANKKFVEHPERNEEAFLDQDLNQFGLSKLKNETNALEPARVEVLPPEVFGSRWWKDVDFVFVDGLRVKVEGAHFANIYSFWGWGDGSHGSNPRRSNDSLKLDNDMRVLLGYTICRLDNPKVHANIIRANMNGLQSFEGSHIHNSRVLTGAAVASVKEAWNTILNEQNLKGEVFATASEESYKRARREKKQVIWVTERVFAVVMAGVSGLRSVDEIFEKEALEEKQRAEKLEKELISQKADQARREAYIKEQAEKAAEEKEKKKKGIRETAIDTGEWIKVGMPENRRVAVEMARLHLINLFALNDGAVNLTGELQFGFTNRNELTLDLEIPEMTSMPRNARDMGPISDFIMNFMACAGSETEVEVRYVRQGDGVYFTLYRSRLDKDVDKFGNYTIGVRQGKLDMPGQSMIRIIIKAHDEDTEFNRETRAILKKLLGQNGKPDVDAYLNSEYYRDFPPAEGRIKAKLEFKQYQAQTREEIKKLNVERKKLHLPLIPDPWDEKTKPKGSEFAHESPLDGSNQDRRTRQEIRRSENKAVGDPDVEEKILSLLHPDSRLGISRHAKQRRRRMVEEGRSTRESLEQKMATNALELLKRRMIPDASLSSGEYSRIRPYLIDHINSETFSTADYEVLAGFEYGKIAKAPQLGFNKPLLSGLGSIPCPPGYRPVGYFHPKGEIRDLRLVGNYDRNVYALNLPRKVEKGLVIFFQKLKNQVDTTEPTEQERAQRVDLNTLSQPWRNLLTELRKSPLTDKQKIDIIIRAWSHRGFAYNDSEDTFRKYDKYGNDVRSPIFLSAILSIGVGNCGYAGLGFVGGSSACGVPVREVYSYLAHPNGDFSMRENLHSVVQVFLDGRWVLIEPQVGYLEAGYELEEIPKSYREFFSSLIEEIPLAEVTHPERMLDLPDMVAISAQEHKRLVEEIVEMYMQYKGADKLSIGDIVRGVTSQVDMIGRRRMALAATKFGTMALVGKIAVDKLAPYVPIATQKALVFLQRYMPESPEKVEFIVGAVFFGLTHLLSVGVGGVIGNMITEGRMKKEFAKAEEALNLDTSYADTVSDSNIAVIMPGRND